MLKVAVLGLGRFGFSAATALCVPHYRTLDAALRAIPAILLHDPTAVEVLDRTVVAEALSNPATAPICGRRKTPYYLLHDGLEDPAAGGWAYMRTTGTRKGWFWPQNPNNQAGWDKKFLNGWYLCGDQGSIDQDGYFWFSGRDDDVINTGGHLVGPFEIESALLMNWTNSHARSAFSVSLEIAQPQPPPMLTKSRPFDDPTS